MPARGSVADPKVTPSQRSETAHAWTQRLIDAGWLYASWPVEYGGRGLGAIEMVVLREEFARAGAAMPSDFVGSTLVGPTLLQWGSEEQKQEFLPGIVRGKVLWCQGFSEPGAGSDLASLRTRAVLDGDEWVIDGQKVWTTQANRADYMFMLARTDPSAPKHQGLSYLLIPMKQPGVEVRPIVQPDGLAEFNEVFFNEARCPKGNVVGGVNNGWKVAMATLGFERGSSVTTSYRPYAEELDAILDVAREADKTSDPLFRQRFARQWSKVQIMRMNGYRTLTGRLRGGHDPAIVALGATNKMFWSETHRETTELAMDVLGMRGQVLPDDAVGDGAVPGGGAIADGVRRGRRKYPLTRLQSSFLFSRSETIWGGTAEIQRNIVSERILGLPKEPRAEGRAAPLDAGSIETKERT